VFSGWGGGYVGHVETAVAQQFLFFYEALPDDVQRVGSDGLELEVDAVHSLLLEDLVGDFGFDQGFWFLGFDLFRECGCSL
jgi:hypothetical protein